MVVIVLTQQRYSDSRVAVIFLSVLKLEAKPCLNAISKIVVKCEIHNEF